MNAKIKSQIIVVAVSLGILGLLSLLGSSTLGALCAGFVLILGFTAIQFIKWPTLIEASTALNLRENLATETSFVHKEIPGVVVGLFYSFLLLIPAFLVTFLLSVPFFFVSVIFFGIIYLISFLFFNTLVFLFSRNKSFNKGILWGYLFTLIICVPIMSGIWYEVKISMDYEDAKNQLDLAIQKNDESLCSTRHGLLFKDTCLGKIAIKKNDTSICDAISSSAKYTCYVSIAISLKNSEICQKIDSATERYKCIMAINPNTDCNTMTDDNMKTNCLYDLAVSKEDPSICDTIYYKPGPGLIPLNKYKIDCYWYSIETSENLDFYKKYCPLFKDNEYKTFHCNKFLNSH